MVTCVDCIRLKTKYERLWQMYVSDMDAFIDGRPGSSRVESAGRKNVADHSRDLSEVARIELQTHGGIHRNARAAGAG
jgi:hypothetical protein